MDNSWVKLYRKIAEHPVIKDAKACQVLLLLFTMVDKKTGKFTTGRFVMSRQLGMNPNTYKDVLKRLEKKYEIITTKSTNKYTEISLLNWANYQNTNLSSPLRNTNKTPTKHQQNTTKQEYKNIEYKTLYREELLKILSIWNITRDLVNGKGVRSFKAIEDNYAYWRNEYSFEDMQEAIKKTSLDKNFLGTISIDTFFRQRNPNKEKVDYIGKALSYTGKTTIDKSGMETYGYIKRN